eukprot:8379420-Pyramimonas_sp.AAC.1
MARLPVPDWVFERVKRFVFLSARTLNCWRRGLSGVGRTWGSQGGAGGGAGWQDKEGKQRRM